MKKYLFLVTAFLLTMSMSMSAQNYNNRRNIDNRRSERIVRLTPQERADLMAKELELTAEQKEKVLALTEKQEKNRLEQVKEQRSQRDLGRQNRDASRDEMRASRQKQVEEHYAELEKIIGKEKVEKWNELRKDVRDSNRAGRRDPRNNRNFRNR